MTASNYVVTFLCLLLLAFTWWNEWQRLNSNRLVLRLLSSFLAVASFACLALPLTRTVQATNTSGTPAVLLTEGFDENSIDSFLRTNKNIPVYALDNKVLAASEKYKSQFLSIADLDSLTKQFMAIHVFGYGFDKDQLKLLPPSSITFHPTKIMDGIASVNWQQTIKAGDRLRVQGNFLNSTAREIKLILSGYDANLDTAVIPANKSANFELTSVPKQLGKAVYTLTAIAGKDTMEKEPVPFETAQPDHLKILILAASPDFENKFLKSWLSQNNYAVVTRTTISRNKYEKTFLNTPQISFNAITASFLHDFDLLIADVSELAAIGKSELAAIESQVVQKGMGLIVKADSAATASSFYSKPFPIHQNSGIKQKDVSIYIPVSNQYASPVVNENPAYILPQPGTKSLISDKQLHVIAGSTIYGAGKLVYTTLNNTFPWMLSGNNKIYQTYWSYILEQATAAVSVDKAWSITPAYPQVDKAVKINYSSNDVSTPRVQIGEDIVYPVQNPDLPFLWQGSYWPKRPGWQPVMQQNSSPFWWYAYSSNDWKTMSALEKINTTLEGITNAHAGRGFKHEAEKGLTTVLISKKYFFLILLCSVGFLWIERKL